MDNVDAPGFKDCVHNYLLNKHIPSFLCLKCSIYSSVSYISLAQFSSKLVLLLKQNKQILLSHVQLPSRQAVQNRLNFSS
jgi:hypothetical protein